MAPKFPLARVKKREQWRWRLDLRSVSQGRKFFETEDEAKSHRETIATEVTNHGTAALSLTYEDRLQFMAAKTKLTTLGATLSQCLDFYAQHHKAESRKTIPQIVTEFLSVKRQSGKRSTYVKALAGWLRRFQAAVKGEYPSDIQPAAIETWMNSAGFAMATRRSLLIDLSTFFTFAIKRGYAVSNPIKQMERITLDDKPPGILTVDQCRALLTTCATIDKPLLPFIAVQLFGGVRPSEARKLLAADFKAGHVQITPATSKTRNRRLVTIGDTLKAWLPKKLAKCFPVTNLARRLAALKLAVKIPWPRDCLRHTAASMMLPILGAAKTANELGHSERVLFQHYRELVTPKDAKAFWALRPNHAKTPIKRGRK